MLVARADEEDELAAAMAHEIAHVAARHMTKQATKSQIVNLAGVPVAVILGGGIGGAVIRQGAGVGIKIADEEDELAAAMAHEIAHVAARHMTKQATKSQIVNLAGVPVAVILGFGGLF